MLKIRKFEAKDFQDVLKIEKECFGKDAYSGETFSHLSVQGDFLVAEDKKVLGYVLYSWSGTIYSIAVKPQYQNRGVGSLLLKKALKDLRGKTNRVRLQTKVSNEKTMKFFKKFGFKPVAKLRGYYREEDGILMIKSFE